MLYSQKVINHFKKPHNQGIINDADAVGQAGNPVCGDVMKIYLKTKKQKNKKTKEETIIISKVKFETLGCAAAIAVSSALTDRLKGASLEEASAITKENLVEDLGGLPPAKIHCSMLGLEALHNAVKEFKN